MSAPLYLLDTSIVMNLVRGTPLGAKIDADFELRNPKARPLICVVTLGELQSMAVRRKWGGAKLQALQNIGTQLVTVDLNHPAIIDAYAEIENFSQQNKKGGASNMGKNDLWVAATAKAAGATLLTADHDFDHLFSGVVTGHYIGP